MSRTPVIFSITSNYTASTTLPFQIVRIRIRFGGFAATKVFHLCYHGFIWSPFYPKMVQSILGAAGYFTLPSSMNWWRYPKTDLWPFLPQNGRVAVLPLNGLVVILPQNGLVAILPQNRLVAVLSQMDLWPFHLPKMDWWLFYPLKWTGGCFTPKLSFGYFTSKWTCGHFNIPPSSGLVAV